MPRQLPEPPQKIMVGTLQQFITLVALEFTNLPLEERVQISKLVINTLSHIKTLVVNYC